MNLEVKRTSRPNVLLLSVDTLRADRLGLYGYGRPTSPALERIAEHATVCDNAFTLGPFTQVACIQLFTSSRPLSHGGYDSGAEGRPETLFKRFRDAGYHTFGLSTIHWVSPYYGYTEGFEDNVGVFFLNTLVGMAFNTMRDTLSAYYANRVSGEEMLGVAVPVIRRMFDNVEDYCLTIGGRMAEYRVDFPDSKLATQDYDYPKVRRVVAAHRRAFEDDPLAYVHRHLDGSVGVGRWMTADWRFSRAKSRLVKEAAFRLSNAVLRRFNPRLASMRDNRYRLSVDAHAIARKVRQQLRHRHPDKPFFIWAHFKDTHQPFVSGPGRNWYRHTPDYLEALGYPRDINPGITFSTPDPKSEDEWRAVSALYDAAVLSTDQAIGTIFEALEELGLAENTVLGICGDHGEEFGEHGDYGHQCMQYEHNARIPMLFRFGRQPAKRLDSLVTALDWAPTIAELAGIEAAPGWEGAPVTSEAVAGRDHVLMENFCRGNCAFHLRPIYMAVRTKRHKYLWREYRDPTHKAETPERALYDLSADPGEQNNLYRPDHPLVAGFNAIIARRLGELPEVSEDRIAAAFATGTAAG